MIYKKLLLSMIVVLAIGNNLHAGPIEQRIYELVNSTYLTNNQIDEIIESIQYYAFDQTEVLSRVKAIITGKLHEQKALLHEPRDDGRLLEGTFISSVGALFAYMGALILCPPKHHTIYRENFEVDDNSSISNGKLLPAAICGLGALSCFNAARSSFYYWLHPQYKEQYRNYERIIKQIDLILQETTSSV